MRTELAFISRKDRRGLGTCLRKAITTSLRASVALAAELLIRVVRAVLTGLQAEKVSDRHSGYLGLIRFASVERPGSSLAGEQGQCAGNQQNVKQHRWACMNDVKKN